MPLPPKLLKKGVTDMVRISDARMSGTAYGTVILHMVPEAAAGGLLALVQNGDMIELDVAKRKLQLLVSPKEIAKRKKTWKKAQTAPFPRLLETLLRPREPGRPGRGPGFPRRQVGPLRAAGQSLSMSDQPRTRDRRGRPVPRHRRGRGPGRLPLGGLGALRAVLDARLHRVLPGVHALRDGRPGRLDRGDRALLPGRRSCSSARRCRCARTTTSRWTTSTG